MKNLNELKEAIQQKNVILLLDQAFQRIWDYQLFLNL